MDIILKEKYFNDIENKLNEIYFLYENFLTLENIIDINSINNSLLILKNIDIKDDFDEIKNIILLKLSSIIKILAENIYLLLEKSLSIKIYIDFLKDLCYLIEKITNFDFEKLNTNNLNNILNNIDFNLLNWDDEDLFFFNLKNEIKQENVNQIPLIPKVDPKIEVKNND
jgi:hypothetical protein